MINNDLDFNNLLKPVKASNEEFFNNFKKTLEDSLVFLKKKKKYEEFYTIKLNSLEKEVTNIEGMKVFINKLKIKKIELEFIENINSSNYIKSLLDENYSHFLKDYGLLDSSVTGVYSGYYENNLEQLSEIFYRIIKNHPFNNGNKRTAIISVKLHLIFNILENFADYSLEESKKKIMKIPEQDYIHNYPFEIFSKKEVDQKNKIIETEILNIWLKDFENEYDFALVIANSESNNKKNIIKYIQLNLVYTIIHFSANIKEISKTIDKKIIENNFQNLRYYKNTINKYEEIDYKLSSFLLDEKIVLENSFVIDLKNTISKVKNNINNLKLITFLFEVENKNYFNFLNVSKTESKKNK